MTPTLALALTTVAALATPQAASAARPAPWYERARCKAAMEAVVSVEPEEAERRLRALERSRDADDVACSVYLRVLRADLRLAVVGATDPLEAERDRYLKRMYAFAKAHAKYGRRFADLEMEARMRRVRVLFERGDRTAAVAEARRAHRMLADRDAGPPSPTVDFVKGAMYSALGQAGSLVRMLLGMAGINGDPDEGHRALRRLAAGSSVYRAEALQLARQFAADMGEDDRDSELGSALPLGDRLVSSFPENPQYAYDHAWTLMKRGEPERGMSVLEPHLERVKSKPDVWAPTMRAKVHYLATRCALSAGLVARARAHRDAMAALAANDYDRRLPGLTRAVEAAEAR